MTELVVPFEGHWCLLCQQRIPPGDTAAHLASAHPADMAAAAEADELFRVAMGLPSPRPLGYRAAQVAQRIRQLEQPSPDGETWVLSLNRYQRDNLLLLLNAVGFPAGNPHADPALRRYFTGDWNGEVVYMLAKPDRAEPHRPPILVVDDDDRPNPLQPDLAPDPRIRILAGYDQELGLECTCGYQHWPQDWWGYNEGVPLAQLAAAAAAHLKEHP